ncbi:MAG: hypothetical protein PHE77_03990 [Candidatus Pacebacteria bacterium]|nr:hypothetical protein [Candidatus Paceibacterota bacterium]
MSKLIPFWNDYIREGYFGFGYGGRHKGAPIERMYLQIEKEKRKDELVRTYEIVR